MPQRLRAATGIFFLLCAAPLAGDIPPTEPEATSETVSTQDVAAATPVPTTDQAVMFTPPTGWGYADTKQLPPSVKAMVVGKGKTAYPPSINLGMEKYAGNLKSYLKIVKGINEKQHADWKDLGTIQTDAGTASLSQVDMHTKWGDVRLMHVILVRDGYAYIMTAAALRDEFPDYYKEMFAAMRSLRFGTPPTAATTVEPQSK